MFEPPERSRGMKNRPKIVLLLETERSFDRQILRGIGQYSSRYGPWAFHIISEGLNRLEPPADLWDASAIIARLSSGRIERALVTAKIPVVVVDTIWNAPHRQLDNRIVRACVDLDGVARLAAAHFLSRGFKHLAFVGTPSRDWSAVCSDGSEYLPECIGQPFILCLSQSSQEQPRVRRHNALINWLKNLPKPIGIIACDDEHGLQVLEACRAARIGVPNQLAVLGVGNDELLCTLAYPTLSSVALATLEGGFQAARMLDRLIKKGNQLPQQLVVRPLSVEVRSSTDIDATDDPHVSAARGVIHRQCSQGVSIDALAESVGISRRTLEKKFRKCTGRTLLQEIHEVRLAKARMMLKQTDLPIARVAALSGYPSVSYFVNTFAKQVGLTPAKYRTALRVTETHELHGTNVWKIAE